MKHGGKSKGEFVISVLRRNFLVIYSEAGFVRVCAIRGVCPMRCARTASLQSCYLDE